MLEAMTHATISFSKGYVVDDKVFCLTISNYEARILLLAEPQLSPQCLRESETDLLRMYLFTIFWFCRSLNFGHGQKVKKNASVSF